MGDEKDYSFQELSSVFSLFDNFIDFNKACIEFVDKVDEKNFEKYQDILKKQEDTLDLNLFQVISGKWYRENFHSDILFEILKKNKIVLDVFIDSLVGEKKEHYARCTLEKEIGKVDLAIIGDGHAIAIENKIYWAKDQDEQLYRYYKYLRKTRKLEVDKIVYLVPDKRKIPSKNSKGCYSKDVEAKKITDEITALIGKPLISYSGNEGDLVSILENALKILTHEIEQKNSNEENYRVFLYNYIDLLKYTGAGDMSVVANNFFNQLFSDNGKKEESRDKLKESSNHEQCVDSKTENFEKLKFIHEMISCLPEFRYNIIADEFGGGKGWPADNQSAWYKTYNTKKNNIPYGIDVKFGQKNDYFCNKTTIEIFYEGSQEDGQEKNNLLKKEFVEILGKEGKNWEINPTSGRLFKEFSFPKENSELIATLKKIEKLVFNPR